jgi:hypothetical protein
MMGFKYLRRPLHTSSAALGSFYTNLMANKLMKALLGLAFLVGVLADQGAVKVVLTPQTLTDLFRAELPAFAKSFTTGVPSIYHPFKFGLTNGHANLTNIFLNHTEIDISKSAISLQNPDTIVATIGSISFFITCDYDIKYGLLHFKGHGSFKLTNVKLVLPTVLTPGILNSYNIAFHNTTFEFGGLKVKTGNFLLSTAIKTAYGLFKNKLEPSIEAGFSQAGQYISIFTLGLNYFPDLVGGLSIDSHPAGPVVVTDNAFATLPINGTVFNKSDEGQFLGTAENSLPNVDPMYKTDQALLSDSFWNSWIFAKFRTLDYTITQLADGTPLDSNVISQVYANFNMTYGEDTAVRVEARAYNTSSGPVTINTQGTDLVATFSIEYVTQVEQGDAWTVVAVTRVSRTFTGGAFITNNLLTIHLTSVALGDVSTLQSTFEVDDALVKERLQTISDEQLMFLNEKLINLPVEFPEEFLGLKVKGQALVLEDTYSTYSFDV